MRCQLDVPKFESIGFWSGSWQCHQPKLPFHFWKQKSAPSRLQPRAQITNVFLLPWDFFPSFWIVFCFPSKLLDGSSVTQAKWDFAQNPCIWKILVCRNDVDNLHSSLPLQPAGFAALSLMSLFSLPFFLLHDRLPFLSPGISDILSVYSVSIISGFLWLGVPVYLPVNLGHGQKQLSCAQQGFAYVEVLWGTAPRDGHVPDARRWQ